MAKRPMKRPSDAPPPEAPLGPDTYKEFMDAFPCLAAHLFDERYEDGSRRATSTLLFFVEVGTLKLCLNDRDAGRVCFMAVESIVQGLLAVEAALCDDTLVWRQKRIP